MKRIRRKSSRLIIRDFRIEDYDCVVELWTSAGLPYRPKGRDGRERIADELKKGTAIFLVAELDGKIVGCVLGTQDGRKGWLNRLAVRPEFQRRGIARMLVEEVEKRLSGMGIGISAALVENWNEKSMDVFERLGYTRHDDITYFSKRKSQDV